MEKRSLWTLGAWAGAVIILVNIPILIQDLQSAGGNRANVVGTLVDRGISFVVGVTLLLACLAKRKKLNATRR